MMFGMVFFWIALLGLAVWALRTLFPSHLDLSGTSQKPLEILAHRYARGEITRTEYEAAKRDLQS